MRPDHAVYLAQQFQKNYQMRQNADRLKSAPHCNYRISESG
jgi:hypothetical protein